MIGSFADHLVEKFGLAARSYGFAAVLNRGVD